MRINNLTFTQGLFTLGELFPAFKDIDENALASEFDLLGHSFITNDLTSQRDITERIKKLFANAETCPKFVAKPHMLALTLVPASQGHEMFAIFYATTDDNVYVDLVFGKDEPCFRYVILQTLAQEFPGDSDILARYAEVCNTLHGVTA